MSSSHAQPTGEQDTSSTAPTHGNAPVDNRRCNMGEFDEGWHAMFPRPAGDNADRFVEYYWRSAKWQALIRAVFFPTASQGLYWAEHGEIWDSSLRNLWLAHGVSLHLFNFGKLVHTGISRLDRFVVGSSDGTVELKRVLVAQRKKMNQVLLLTVTELQKIVRSADRCPMEKPVGYHLPMDLILVVERFVFESYSPARLEQEQYGFWTAIYRQAIEGLPEEEVKCADPRIIDFYSGDPSEVREEIEHNSIASATQLFGGRMPQLTDFELRVVAFRAEFQRFPLRLRPLLSDVEDERASRMIHASFLLDGPLYREELIRHRNQHHAYMAIKYIQFWLLTIDKQRRFPDDMAGPCEAEMMEFEAMHQRLSREIFRVEIAPDLSQRSSCFHNVDDLLMFHRKIIGNVLNDCDTLWEEIKEAGVRGLRRAIYQDWAQGEKHLFHFLLLQLIRYNRPHGEVPRRCGPSTTTMRSFYNCQYLRHGFRCGCFDVVLRRLQEASGGVKRDGFGPRRPYAKLCAGNHYRIGERLGFYRRRRYAHAPRR